MKKFKRFLLNLGLFFAAIILVILFSGVGLITSVYYIIFKKSSTEYFRDCAIELDCFGNVFCGHFFNTLLIKKESKYLFGKVNCTISKVLGENQREKTLSKVGNLLANTLDFIDKDHCKNSI